ncbi:MAG: sigma 54-interacting transcriptional regulator [Phycisphaerales bacterium JB038]
MARSDAARIGPSFRHALIIVSDDESFVQTVSSAYGEEAGVPAIAPDWPAARDFVDVERWQLLVIDASSDDPRWREWIPLIEPEESRLLAIMVAGSRDAEQAVTATRLGFWEYLIKPLEKDRLREVIADAKVVLSQSEEFEGTAREPRVEKERDGADRLIGQSPAMQEVYKQIGTAAPQNVDVLITGESGTGKELVCRALHRHSARSDGPYIGINCAAVPETLLESELFGHERGAFTGADRQRVGRFEQAKGGVVLLDEIGDMSPSLQAKLLRLIQDRTFYRVGGNELIRCDTRIFAATHQDLEKRIKQGLFREDLYYRLSVVAIHLPPLREREVDAILIAHDVVAELNRELGRHITSFHPQTVRAILSYSWPGNVRELQNVIKQAMLAAHGSALLPAFLPEHLRQLAEQGTAEAAEAAAMNDVAAPIAKVWPAGGETGADINASAELAASTLRRATAGALTTAVEELEREMIRLALMEHRGNISAASRHLGNTRLTLRKKMDLYGLKRSTVVE